MEAAHIQLHSPRASSCTSQSGQERGCSPLRPGPCVWETRPLHSRFVALTLQGPGVTPSQSLGGAEKTGGDRSPFSTSLVKTLQEREVKKKRVPV